MRFFIFLLFLILQSVSEPCGEQRRLGWQFVRRKFLKTKEPILLIGIFLLTNLRTRSLSYEGLHTQWPCRRQGNDKKEASALLIQLKGEELNVIGFFVVVF